MFSKKTLIADLLFWIQIVFAFLFSVPQFFRLLESTNGQSLSMQIVMLGFILLNLSLAFGSYRIEPSRNTLQIIAVYVMWSIFVSSNIGAIFWNGKYSWSTNDTATTYLVAISAFLILTICKLKNLGLKEPATKGSLSIVFKALPQFMMALKIANEGGAGVPMVTIIVGNITVCIRVGQILLAKKEMGWDKNLLWLFIAEATNEISWAVVSMVWLGWRISF